MAAVDCASVRLKSDTLSSGVNRIIVTISGGSLKPVHSTANRVVYHVWEVSDVKLQASDSQLSQVVEWNQPCHLLSTDRYQNARLTSSAVISSEGIAFTATNILPLIADKVRQGEISSENLLICVFSGAAGGIG